MSEPEKKKRRQNVACDSCRLRRVKCDMLTLLSSRTGSTDPAPPLHILVAQNPDVACSNCIGKGIRCTTNQIVNPAKPNKGGRRIEAAKRVFGSDGSVPQTEDGSFAPTMAPTPIPGQTHAFMPQAQPSDNFMPLLDPDFLSASHTVGSFHPGEAAGSSAVTPGSDMAWAGPLLDSFLGSTDVLELPADTYGAASAPPPLPMGPEVPGSVDYSPLSELFGLTTPQLSNAGPSSTEWAYLGVSHNPALVGPATGQAVPPGLVYSNGSLLVGRKRRHFDADDDDEDGWRLWAPRDKQAVRWSRREIVGEDLADRSLGHQLSRHLVHLYFNSVHLVLPTISPESFYMDWQRAGQRSDRMTPAQEALCGVIEAWAAKFSDNPIILNLAKENHHLGPKVITDSGTFVPGELARSQWGKARRKVCAALTVRAKQLLDQHGILTSPSVTGVQALCLYSQLHHMSDLEEGSAEHEMEGRMIHTIMIEQMKLLDLSWNATDQHLVSPDEAEHSLVMMRVKQRRLFWTVIVSDSFWAASSGNEPKISDEDIEASGEWLVTVEDALAPSTFKALSFVMSVYHGCAIIGRAVARKLAIPMKRPGAIDVNEFGNRVRSIWRDIRNLYRDLNQRTPDILAGCQDDILGFSPLHQLSSLRNSCTFLLLVVHQLIHQLREFRKGLREAFVHSNPSTPETASSPHTARDKIIEDIFSQSVDVTLGFTRAQTPLFESLIPTGMLQGASMMLRMGLASVQFLAEIPTNEQGYPSDTLGGTGWTWGTKQKEVALWLDALEQLGWAWADASDVVDSVKSTMERMQPTPGELLRYESAPRPKDTDGIVAQRQRDLERDNKAIQAALKLWPPLSVAQVVGEWSKTAIEPTATVADIDFHTHKYPRLGTGTPPEAVRANMTMFGAYSSSATNLSPDSMSRTSSDSVPQVVVTSDGVITRATRDPHTPARNILVPPGVLWNMTAPPFEVAMNASRAGDALNPETLVQLGTPQPDALGQDLESLLDQLVAEGAVPEAGSAM